MNTNYLDTTTKEKIKHLPGHLWTPVKMEIALRIIYGTKLLVSCKNFKNLKSIASCKCNICGRKWKTAYYNLVRGAGCPLARSRGFKKLINWYHKQNIVYFCNKKELKNYKNEKSRFTVKCRQCGYKWNTSARTLTKLKRCPKCENNHKMQKGIKHFLHFYHKQNKYILVNPKELNHYHGIISTRLTCQCLKCDYKWQTTIDSLLHNHACPKCAGKMPINIYKAKDKIKKFYCNSIDVLFPKLHIKERDYVWARCKNCGHLWKTTINALLFKQSGCNFCQQKRIGKECSMKSKLNFLYWYDFEQNQYKLIKPKQLNNYLKYKNNIKLTVRCLRCGYVFTCSLSHLTNSNHGCLGCYRKRIQKQVIDKFFKWYFSQSQLELLLMHKYQGRDTKISMQCTKCQHKFTCPISHFITYCGCPFCTSYHGEIAVDNFIKKYYSDCHYQHSFKIHYYHHRYHSHPLSIDFIIIINNNIYAIEYDGIQHKEPVDFFGGKPQLRVQKKHDKIKNNWCKDKGIKMIRIDGTQTTGHQKSVQNLVNVTLKAELP